MARGLRVAVVGLTVLDLEVEASLGAPVSIAGSVICVTCLLSTTNFSESFDFFDIFDFVEF